MIQKKTNMPGFIFGLLAAACWGGGTVISKSSLDSFPPIPLLIIQLSASVILLWLVVFFKKIKLLKPGEILKFAWLGFLEPYMAYILILFGLTTVKSGEAVLIQSLESIMIVVAGFVLYKNRPHAKFLIMSMVALLGVYLSLELAPEDEAFINSGGLILIALGTLIAAVYVVLSSRLAISIDAAYVVACQHSVALFFALLMIPFEWSGFFIEFYSNLSFGIWCLAILSGVVQYALAFTFYTMALKKISANVAGMLLGFVPIFGIAGGGIFLQEAISQQQLIGVSIAIIAIVYIGFLGDGSEAVQDVVLTDK